MPPKPAGGAGTPKSNINVCYWILRLMVYNIPYTKTYKRRIVNDFTLKFITYRLTNVIF